MPAPEPARPDPAHEHPTWQCVVCRSVVSGVLRMLGSTRCIDCRRAA